MLSNADILAQLQNSTNPNFNPNPTAPPNRFGPGVAPPMQIPTNQQQFAPGSFMNQAMQLSGVPSGPPAGFRPSPPGSPPNVPPGTSLPPPGGGGPGSIPGASPYAYLNEQSPWLASLPQSTIQKVNDYYTGITDQPKRANSQMVQDFFMVNMGRRATPREVEYYTDGKRFDQLFTNTGRSRAGGTPARTGNTGTSNNDPLDPSYWDWWEQTQQPEQATAALGGNVGQNKGTPGQIPNLPFNMTPELMQRIQMAMAGRA